MNNTQTSSPATMKPINSTSPRFIRAVEALVTELPGERGSLKLPSALTAGCVTVATAEVGANGGPPPHVHANEEEIFLIRSGAFEFFVNGEVHEVRAGDVVYAQRGEAHRFRGLDSGEPNVFDNLIAPGGFEHFYPRWARLFDNGAPDMQAAIQLTGEYGITLFPSDDVAPVVAEPRSTIVRAEQTPLQMMGTTTTVLLRGSETGGKYSLIRIEGPADAGPPIHIHQNEDELFLVEAGQVEFTLGENVVLAETGDVVWAPRGFAHTFRLASDGACIAVLMTPGGLDQFFVDCALNELAGEVEPSTIVALCEQYGMKLLLPNH